MSVSGINPNAGVSAAGSSAPRADASGDTRFADVLSGKLSSGTDLDAIFAAAARKYGVSENLLKAVARAESNFNPDATSSCGAMGVMQLMPSTAKALGVTDAYDPTQNIMGGANYLRQMLDRFGGDSSLALAAYNAGPGSVEKYGGVPPYAETQSYVQKVLSSCGESIAAGTVSGTASGAAADGSEEALAALMLMSLYQMRFPDNGDAFQV
jgi:soluble lytic murein transglycosylase-like protein